MELGPFIPEVNILCVKLKDSRPPQANIFLKNGTFWLQEYAFFYENTSSTSNFEVRTLVPPSIPKFLLPTPF